MSKNGRGEGSIVHRKDGRWQGMVSCGYKPDGSLNRKYFYGKTRAETADKVQRALAELKDGTFIDKNTNPTVEAWLNE